jgi:2-keto-3-deoxy-L-rhamnonate aldolase RhmA
MFDYVEFLGEYAAYDLKGLDNFCRAAELHSLGSMIKVDWESRGFFAQRSVGAGFDGVLFADPRSAQDVAESVRYLRPDTPEEKGLFGVAPRRHSFPMYGSTPEYVQALKDTVVVVMIEKQAAVERLDEILEVGGVDMVQWGPADYAMSVGRPGQEQSDAIREVERRVIRACLEAGIPPRAEILTVEQAKYYLDLGVRHFSLGYDLFSIFETLKDGGERLRRVIEDGQ